MLGVVQPGLEGAMLENMCAAGFIIVSGAHCNLLIVVLCTVDSTKEYCTVQHITLH